MSPGTRWVTSTLTGSPSRVAATSWRISECIASAARSARYSLANPRPTDAATITPMMRASSPSPTTPDTAAAASNSHSNGLCSWRDSTDHALARWERTAFGPKTSDRAATSAAVESRRPGPDGLEHLLRCQRRGRLDRRQRGSVERGGGDGHTQVWAATQLLSRVEDGPTTTIRIRLPTWPPPLSCPDVRPAAASGGDARALGARRRRR